MATYGKKNRTDEGEDIVKTFTFTPYTSTLLKFYYKNIFRYYIYILRLFNATDLLYILLIITIFCSCNAEQLQELIDQMMN